jgi:O-antigen ligase
MLTYLRSNIQFLIIVSIWIMLGLYARPLTYVIVPLLFFLMIKKNLDENIFIGFFAILILSDSFYLGFAKDIKPIVLLLLSTYFFFNPKKFQPFTDIPQSFYLFFFYAIVLLFNSMTFTLSFQKTLSYILLFIVVPNFLMMVYRKNGQVFLKNLIWFPILILIAGFLIKFIYPEVAISHNDRFRGVFGNPNGLAMFSVLIYLLLSVIEEYFPELFNKTEKILIYAAIFGSIIWSGSRSSMMCIIIFWLFSRTQKKSTILSFIVFIIIAIAYKVVSDNILYIIQSLNLSSYFRLDTIKEGSGRIFAWRYAWEEIQKNFFFGRGFDYNQYLFFIPETQHKLNMLNHQGDVHNVYLGFWLDVGLVGLIMYFTAFIYTFYKANQKSHLAFPIMFAMLFMGNYEPWLIASLNPFTIQFLMIVTIIINCKPLNAPAI